MEVNVIDEKHPGKVAAVFTSEAQAKAACQALTEQGNFKAKNVNIIRPEDSHVSEKIEPDSQGIYNTIIKSHAILGIVGLIVGFIIASLFIAFGPTFAQSSPLPTYLAFSFFGLLIGMMIAGAVSLRPDHDPLINESVAASQDNKWTVVVQLDNREEVDQAKSVLEKTAESVTETI